jgi:hypothetical protein
MLLMGISCSAFEQLGKPLLTGVSIWGKTWGKTVNDDTNVTVKIEKRQTKESENSQHRCVTQNTIIRDVSNITWGDWNSNDDGISCSCYIWNIAYDGIQYSTSVNLYIVVYGDCDATSVLTATSRCLSFCSTSFSITIGSTIYKNRR